MRRIVVIALFAVIFLAGLSLMLYPTISDSLSSRRQTQAVTEYFSVVEGLSEQDFSELFQAAHEYNEGLHRNPNRFIMTDEENAHYRRLLNPLETGIIGTLEIDVIDVHLPIYHGTDTGVLRIGLGHMEGTSLPVGGPGTHTVITGHRGLPSATLLTHLDSMAIGDLFHVHVLDATLTYRVDQIMIVLPHETGELALIPDADYCTLVTCTPYGLNTHRLLVRGRRVQESIPDFETPDMPAFIPPGARILNGTRAALLLVLPALIVIATLLFIKLRRIYGKGEER